MPSEGPSGPLLDLFVTPELRDRLPDRIRRFVGITDRRDHVIDVMPWSLAELGVPPLAEPRNFRVIARYVAVCAATDHDVRLVIVPRFGPRQEYRQVDLR